MTSSNDVTVKPSPAPLPGLNRRGLLASAGVLAASCGFPSIVRAAPSIGLPPLPYDVASLQPVISAAALGLHHGKHHQSYVDNLAKLLPSTRFDGLSLEAIVKASVGLQLDAPVFNNAAQIWNHTFYWHSLSPRGGGKPPLAVARAIDAAWGSFAAFREAFVKQATSVFGSGWLWLCWSPAGKTLQLVETSNADTPIRTGQVVPLAVIDVWEHAYYMDFRNQRKAYVEAVFDKLFNWAAVDGNLARAMEQRVVSAGVPSGA